MSSYLTIPASAIVTYSGKVIEPLNPDPEQICIEDIAHALSNQCRFTGHTKEFYSVAQHAVACTHLVPEEDRLWALLHDASEAYLADIARPVKKFTDWGAEYLEVEEALMNAVADAFGLPEMSPEDYGLLMPASVKAADDLMLRTEMRDLMPEGVADTMPGPTLPFKLTPLTPEEAEQDFLYIYYSIVGEDAHRKEV